MANFSGRWGGRGSRAKNSQSLRKTQSPPGGGVGRPLSKCMLPPLRVPDHPSRFGVERRNFRHHARPQWPQVDWNPAPPPLSQQSLAHICGTDERGARQAHRGTTRSRASWPIPYPRSGNGPVSRPGSDIPAGGGPGPHPLNRNTAFISKPGVINPFRGSDPRRGG